MMFFCPIFMISSDNIEEVKEAIYWHCKGKQSLRIGSLMSLRRVLDSVLHDTSPQHFRIIEACHYLRDQGYIEIKNADTKGCVFSIGTHYATAKLWNEFKSKEKEEQAKLEL